MLRRIVPLIYTCIILAVVCLSHANTSEAEVQKKMVLTFDDLPYVGLAHSGGLAMAEHATGAILEVLEKYDAPAAAFVNEGMLWEVGGIDERVDLLRKWSDAGVVLGNHTYSHVSLNSVTVEQFKDEIVRGDVAIRQLMAGRGGDKLYFRHPYTHTGDTAAKKSEIDRFLLERGYTIVPYTIDSQDYIFNVLYRDSIERADAALSNRICDTYVDFVIKATSFAERMGEVIFKRPIPQTIILHAKDVNAGCLDALLESFVEDEYGFIPLDKAMEDPAYQTPDTFVTRAGSSWLWRWSRSLEMEVSFVEDPEPPQWVLDTSRGLSH